MASNGSAPGENGQLTVAGWTNYAGQSWLTNHAKLMPLTGLRVRNFDYRKRTRKLSRQSADRPIAADALIPKRC